MTAVIAPTLFLADYKTILFEPRRLPEVSDGGDREKTPSLTHIQSPCVSLKALPLQVPPPPSSITDLRSPPNASLIAACLFCVALTKERAVYEGGRTLKCRKMFYVLCFFFCRGSLRVSPTVTHGRLSCRRGCFCCGNCGVKRWDGGLLRWDVFGFCCRIVCCCFFVALGPFLDPTKLRRSLLTHLFLPSF